MARRLCDDDVRVICNRGERGVGVVCNEAFRYHDLIRFVSDAIGGSLRPDRRNDYLVGKGASACAQRGCGLCMLSNNECLHL